MNLYLDVETTALPRKDYKWDKDFLKFPRIVSIAWRMGGRDNYYILNQSFKPIPESATKIHGITDEMCARSTHFPKDIFPLLIRDAMEADHIVGFNLYFDTSMFKANVLRVYGPDSPHVANAIQALDKSKRIDVMRRTAKFNGGWIQLAELYKKLFDSEIRGHHALEDVVALERCHNKLIEMGILKDSDI